MKLRFLQVDAFAGEAFGGNPAAVVFLEEPLADEVMLAIARENNLSETAFLQRQSAGHYSLRWFTPTVEVDLCGHATLAAGYAVLRHEEPEASEVTFETRSGPLVVERAGDELRMDLPSIPPGEEEAPAEVIVALGRPCLHTRSVRKVHHADYWLARFASVADIDALDPDIEALRRMRCNVVCTAPGEGDVDFVSRFFGPASGVAEDPVTGSAHATLAPYWAAELGRTRLRAHQRSMRGGWLTCEVRDDRVLLEGPCVQVIEGTLSF